MAEVRFPPPWTVEELDACFVGRDSNGQQLAYVYFEDAPGRRLGSQVALAQCSPEQGTGTKTHRLLPPQNIDLLSAGGAPCAGFCGAGYFVI
jgi:hypothetical protein